MTFTALLGVAGHEITFVINCHYPSSLDNEWELRKLKYAKEYEDEAAESVHRLVWKNNWQYV